MEFRTIRQTSHIDGTNRNPGINEHNKSLVWDNNTAKFKYILTTTAEINTNLLDGLVSKGSTSTAADFIWKLDANKNPAWRKEEYLKTIQRPSGSNSAIFTMNSGSTKTLALGAMAWLDTAILPTPALPGDTKILFDYQNTIGGTSSFTFDNNLKTLNLSAFTGIQVKNNPDTVYKGVLQYFGNKNLLLGHGITRSLVWATNLSNNILIGDSAGGGLQTGSNNLILGHFAGSDTDSGIEGSIYIGNYAGRLETVNNRFYLSNTNYNTLSEAKLGSLLYGELNNGLLKVNNRLEVKQEVKLGTFDILNTPTWGMLQFIGTGNVNEYKPQYYNGLVWQDFASGSNYYLNTVTKTTDDVGTVDDVFKLTFDMNGQPDFTLQLGANAFNSSVIPQASYQGESGLFQLSSGDSTDSNAGFTSISGLKWNVSESELLIPGAINLITKAKYTTSSNSIIYDGSHYYGRIGSNWLQLDNESFAKQYVFVLSLPLSNDVFGRIAGATLPTGFVISVGESSYDLLITHSLNRKVANVTIMAVDGQEETLLIGSAAYTGLKTTLNTCLIMGLTNTIIPLTVNLLFS